MEDPTHRITKKRDRTNENFRRAVENGMRRWDRIGHPYQADVYVMVRRRGQYFEYTSKDSPSWPTPAVEVVGAARTIVSSPRLLTMRKSKDYPLPIRKRPADFMQRRSLVKKNKEARPIVDGEDPPLG